ncbi:DNA mismatch repair endonuclease MutL [Haloprofundus sp. MHR1]|uniref:DNA mismatch repair endonuclease MutL n=1 Tax=Haloprofundus sp. MHR1 TaxID=2572921 RepID=UPI0010BF6027|nr:DNA mismatch repair endonuclease MutL [Haloprofundus sp. MHR1]QCJ45725.1 DNA mismatch repair endonuclease MutL [Haloprofundus sp. MHR1]
MISRLDSETIAKIAAGEVVTRPASVVTELVENSLDAGATRVDVTVDGDGTERIRVADDGAGMGEDDAALAVERHTTSKLDGPDDVDAVDTLGFRGEALPSMASVATLDVTTNDGGPRGTRVVVEDGEKRVDPAGRAVGTTVEVRDLFHNRPARRKSLAAARTEFGRISDVVTRYALANPRVRFSLTHDGRETFKTTGTGYTDAVLGAYGRDVAGQSTEFDHRTTVEFDGDEYSLEVEGLLVYPSITRAQHSHVHTAVNGRALRDEVVRRAAVRGYGNLLSNGRFPVAVVTVSLPPELVDANVHPAKERVAFRDESAVADAVETAVNDALTTADLRRSAAVAMDLDSSLASASRDSDFDDVSVIGQFRELYLLCEADDDLLVVDQHAAHERVNYERLRAALDGEEVASVDVDPAQTLSLSPPEAAAVESHRETLSRLGFDLDPFGGSAFRLTAVPAPLGRVLDADALRDTLDTLRAGAKPEELRDELLKDLACHPSLKAGDTLSGEDATALLRRLGECDQPYACPHGRPTVLSIEEEALVRGFQRGQSRLA